MNKSWLAHKWVMSWDMTHSCVSHDLYIYVLCMTHSYVSYDSLICGPTYEHICRSWLTYEWVIPQCGTTYERVMHNVWVSHVTHIWQCVAECCRVLQCGAVWCSVLQCVAVCCSVLQYVALCCSVLQCVAACIPGSEHTPPVLQAVADSAPTLSYPPSVCVCMWVRESVYVQHDWSKCGFAHLVALFLSLSLSLWQYSNAVLFAACVCVHVSERKCVCAGWLNNMWHGTFSRLERCDAVEFVVCVGVGEWESVRVCAACSIICYVARSVADSAATPSTSPPVFVCVSTRVCVCVQGESYVALHTRCTYVSLYLFCASLLLRHPTTRLYEWDMTHRSPT